jgi:hypothetical protein
MNTQTITAPMTNGDLAVFKLGFTSSVEEFVENVGLVVSPQCVLDGEEMGLWSVL